MPTIVDFLVQRVGHDIADIILSYVDDYLLPLRITLHQDTLDSIGGLYIQEYSLYKDNIYIKADNSHMRGNGWLICYPNRKSWRILTTHIYFKSYYCGRCRCCNYVSMQRRIYICDDIRKRCQQLQVFCEGFSGKTS